MALRKYRKALRYLDVCWELEDINEGETFVFFLIEYHLLSISDEFMFVIIQRTAPLCGTQSLRYSQIAR